MKSFKNKNILLVMLVVVNCVLPYSLNDTEAGYSYPFMNGIYSNNWDESLRSELGEYGLNKGHFFQIGNFSYYNSTKKKGCYAETYRLDGNLCHTKYICFSIIVRDENSDANRCNNLIAQLEIDKVSDTSFNKLKIENIGTKPMIEYVQINTNCDLITMICHSIKANKTTGVTSFIKAIANGTKDGITGNLKGVAQNVIFLLTNSISAPSNSTMMKAVGVNEYTDPGKKVRNATVSLDKSTYLSKAGDYILYKVTVNRPKDIPYNSLFKGTSIYQTRRTNVVFSFKIGLREFYLYESIDYK